MVKVLVSKILFLSSISGAAEEEERCMVGRESEEL